MVSLRDDILSNAIVICTKIVDCLQYLTLKQLTVFLLGMMRLSDADVWRRETSAAWMYLTWIDLPGL